jgi:hypothetical protein
MRRLRLPCAAAVALTRSDLTLLRRPHRVHDQSLFCGSCGNMVRLSLDHVQWSHEVSAIRTFWGLGRLLSAIAAPQEPYQLLCGGCNAARVFRDGIGKGTLVWAGFLTVPHHHRNQRNAVLPRLPRSMRAVLWQPGDPDSSA